MTAGHMPTLLIPWRTTSKPAPMAQHRRLALICKLTHNTDLPLSDRVAGLLVLFYAQPVSRIITLTIADVILDADTVLLRLGDPPSPAPEPLAGLLREPLAHRRSFRGPNADTDWLFPGRRAAQPMVSRNLSERLREHARLPPQTRRPPRHRRWRHLEPLRTRRPHPVMTQPIQEYRSVDYKSSPDSRAGWCR
jgi:hypothetical protein